MYACRSVTGIGTVCPSAFLCAGNSLLLIFLNVICPELKILYVNKNTRKMFHKSYIYLVSGCSNILGYWRLGHISRWSRVLNDNNHPLWRGRCGSWWVGRRALFSLSKCGFDLAVRYPTCMELQHTFVPLVCWYKPASHKIIIQWDNRCGKSKDFS